MEVKSSEQIKFGRLIAFTCTLLKNFFCAKRENSSRDLKVRWILQTRAWLVFIGYTAIRLVQLAAQRPGWFKREKNCNEEGAELGSCLYKYNSELLDPNEDFFRKLLSIVLVISGFICFICFKWRNLIDVICYLECLTRIIAAFIPSSINQNQSAIQVTMHTTITMIAFYNDSRGHLISLFVLQCVNVFFMTHVAYLEPFTLVSVLTDIWITVVTMLCMLLITLTIFYIAQLHQKLEFTNTENVKLLDGMHEGLCIISKP